ncbi:MAG: ABC transporter substrate-binding protein, partial [Dehalococcoidia bacterium]
MLLTILIITLACNPDSRSSTASAPSDAIQNDSGPRRVAPVRTPTPDPDAQTPEHGGILILANRGDPPVGFDTLRTSSIALNHVGGSLFGPGNLVRRCRANMFMICPDLATNWTAAPGFKEWTFTVRPDAFWHDGPPLTAEDIKFWLEIAAFGAEANGKRRASAYARGQLGMIERVEALPNNQLRVTLAERNAQFLEVLANPRLKIAHPRHLMEERLRSGELTLTPLAVGLVGTGPFRLEQYQPGTIVRVRRFERYWERDNGGRRLPYLDGIDFIIMPEPFAMDAAFRTGRIHGGARGRAHYLSVPRKEAYDRALGDQVTYAQVGGSTFRLAFNVLRPGPWEDARVRRAISLWIDKQAAIPVALGGFGWTSPGLGPENPFDKKLFLNWPKFDRGTLEERRAEAVRLMTEAGHAEGFTMGHVCRAISTERCLFLKDQLAGLGIDLRLDIVDEGRWNQARVSLGHDSQQGAGTPPTVPEAKESVYGRFSQNPDAYSKHEDTVIDDFFRQLRQALTLPQRVDIWRRLERYIFAEQAYIVPIAVRIEVIPYRTYVRGLVIPPEDDHTHTDFTTVWLD